MIGNPSELLQEQRRRVEELAAQLAREQHKLEGMEEMFGAFPTLRRRAVPAAAAVAIGAITGSEPRHAGGGPAVSSGRQPGSISKKWRDVLAELWRAGAPFIADQAAELVRRLEGRTIKPSEAKRVLESYQEHGYVVRNGAGEFIVTDEAATKFGFSRPVTSAGGDNTWVARTPDPLGTTQDLISGGVAPLTLPQPRVLHGDPLVASAPAGIGSKGWWERAQGEQSP